MLQLLGIGLVVMIAADAFVGVRLIALARSTRRLPELFFGLSFLCMGVLGYPLSIIARKLAMAGAPVPALLPAAHLIQDLAALSMFVATWQTFRPADRWPRWVLCIGAGGFALSLTGESLVAGTWAFRDGGPWYELGFWLRTGSYLCAAVEAGRYYGRMRRRWELGLADAVVTDRFRLWTISSTAVFAAFLIFYVGRIWAGNVSTSAPVLAATSLVGFLAGITVWLAFVPPDAYVRRVRERAEARARGLRQGSAASC